MSSAHIPEPHRSALVKPPGNRQDDSPNNPQNDPQGSRQVLEVNFGTGVRAGFTTRDAGASRGPFASLNLGHHVGDDPQAVTSNRAAVSGWAGAPLQFAEQVHGTASHVVSEVSCDLPTADALIARLDTSPRPDPSHSRVDPARTCIGLAIVVADCCPILLADPDQNIIAAIHAGRAGLVNGIVPQTIHQLHAMGATSLRAAIGPTICGSCYEVPPAMASEAEKVAPASRSLTQWGTPGIDIAAGVATQLEATGVSVINTARICTYEDPRFYSHRRTTHQFAENPPEAHERGTITGAVITGRFAGIISLTPSA